MSATENSIDDAIRAHLAAEGWQGVPVGWVVLVATVDYDGDQEVSGIAQIYPGGSMPWTQALGIVEGARLKMHADFLRDEP